MTTGILHDWSPHSATCLQCAAPFAGSVADDCHPGLDAAEPEDAWAALRAMIEALERDA